MPVPPCPGPGRSAARSWRASGSARTATRSMRSPCSRRGRMRRRRPCLLSQPLQTPASCAARAFPAGPALCASGRTPWPQPAVPSAPTRWEKLRLVEPLPRPEPRRSPTPPADRAPPPSPSAPLTPPPPSRTHCRPAPRQSHLSSLSPLRLPKKLNRHSTVARRPPARRAWGPPLPALPRPIRPQSGTTGPSRRCEGKRPLLSSAFGPRSASRLFRPLSHAANAGSHKSLCCGVQATQRPVLWARPCE